MEEKKFNHMPGGKVFILIMLIVLIGIITLVFLLFTERSVDFISAIMLLVFVGGLIWLLIKLYKPGFTELRFTEEGINTKTHFASETLLLKDIEGIWLIKPPFMKVELEEYTPQSEKLGGAILIIGDYLRFDGAHFIGIFTSRILHDSFASGYTTVYYRKELDPILHYYYNKISSKRIQDQASI